MVKILFGSGDMCKDGEGESNLELISRGTCRPIIEINLSGLSTRWILNNR
jgi:hypothetical protein